MVDASPARLLLVQLDQRCDSATSLMKLLDLLVHWKTCSEQVHQRANFFLWYVDSVSYFDIKDVNAELFTYYVMLLLFLQFCEHCFNPVPQGLRLDNSLQLSQFSLDFGDNIPFHRRSLRFFFQSQHLMVMTQLLETSAYKEMPHFIHFHETHPMF